MLPDWGSLCACCRIFLQSGLQWPEPSFYSCCIIQSTCQMFTYKILRKFSTISTFKPSLLQTVNIHTIFKGNYNNINIHYSYKKAKRKSKCELNSKFSKTRGSPYSCEEQNKVLIPATWKLWERLRNVQTVNFCKSGYRYQSHLSHMLSCGKCLNGIKHKCFSPSAILNAHASYFLHIIYNVSRVITWCW